VVVPGVSEGHSSLRCVESWFVCHSLQLPEMLGSKGIVFIGPSAAPMHALGDKIGATIIAQVSRLVASECLPLAHPPCCCHEAGRHPRLKAVFGCLCPWQSAGVPTIPWNGAHLRASYKALGGLPQELVDAAGASCCCPALLTRAGPLWHAMMWCLHLPPSQSISRIASRRGCNKMHPLFLHTSCSIGMHHRAEYTCCSSVAFERPNENALTLTLHVRRALQHSV
jgi:hypothetical protein